MNRTLPDPFAETDAKQDLIEAIITRDEIENLKLQVDWLQEQVRALMSGFSMLAEAERFRIQKVADKIKS